MLFVDTSIIHYSSEGVLILCNILDLLIYSLDKDIETELKKDNDIQFMAESDLSNACVSFKKIYYDFVGEFGSSVCIKQIIHKYKDLCWNDLHPHYEIEIIYRDSSEIDEPIKWFSENHILHSFCKIDSNDKSIEKIKRIASSAKVSLDELWGCHVEDDEWIKENINKIKTPIFVKVNDVSIYSKPGTKSVDIVSVGFNKNVLFDKLIC